MLQAEASVLGIGHPSGYPTYMMLTHLFTYLPFGDEAHLTNLASAVYGAVSVALFYAISLRLSGRVVAAAAGALAFAVSATFWSQAVITEVYTLNTVFIGLIFLILLVWRDTRGDRYLLLTAFVMGLSLTHHLTSGILLPGGFAFIFLTERRKLFETRLMLKGLGLFLLGLTPYIYLPIRALMNAPLTEADPSTLGRFLLLVTGVEPVGPVSARQEQLRPFAFPIRGFLRTTATLRRASPRAVPGSPDARRGAGRYLPSLHRQGARRSSRDRVFRGTGPIPRLPKRRHRRLLRFPDPRVSVLWTLRLHRSRHLAPPDGGPEPEIQLLQTGAADTVFRADACRSLYRHPENLCGERSEPQLRGDVGLWIPSSGRPNRTRPFSTTGAHSGTWSWQRKRGATSP